MNKKIALELYIYQISLTGYSGGWLIGLERNVNSLVLSLTTVLSF